ncbi:calcium-translocating P-type ATPase, PMCA-type [Helicobacter mesocricetorum]|uniref:calcium-translocating P-type ATPase, PMCA-type n=1 Tax=Helicobacter mesocricetorum TaxID=87012 RepID=UPI001F3C9E85|nr:calcium-translocating P-type ATPase, PMCA-type [Helicobacter mesocricetorum]
MQSRDYLSILLQKYDTNISFGLTHQQVLENERKFGKNSLDKSQKTPLFKQLLEIFKEPIMVLLLFAAFLALAVNIYEFLFHQEGNFLETIGIFIAIFLSAFITLAMENRSNKAFESLNKFSKDNKVRVIRDGKMQFIGEENIVVGDIIFLESGDKIPSDCRILRCQDLFCDESSLTGESFPVAKSATKSALKESFNEGTLYKGCFIVQGNVKALCIAVGNQTEFGKIALALNTISSINTPLQEKLKSLGKKITIFGVLAAVLAFFIQIGFFFLQGGVGFERIADIFVSSIVLIVACVPEGLPAIVAISLALNIIKMSKQNALVKKLVACESIGCVNIICSDKTGTLTQNQMCVEQSFIRDRIFKDGKTLDEIPNSHFKDSMIFLLNNAVLNSTAEVTLEDGKYKFIGNPTECALLVYGYKLGVDYKQMRAKTKIIQTYPFSSETKNMTTIIEVGNDKIAFSKGSPEKILTQCDLMQCQDLQKIQKQILYYQQQAYRVIAFAYRVLSPIKNDNHTRESIESKMEFCGFVAIIDPLRLDVFEAICDCKKAGIEVKMLTGDSLETAKAVGKTLGLLEGDSMALEAKDIELMTKEQLLQSLPKIKIIARSTPSIKMQIVNILKSVGNVVALTGDGINDAPALKNADVGIAMGISGTEVSKEASDIVLLDDSFTTIVKAIEWGRGIYQNFQRFIQFQLIVNLSSVIIVLGVVIMGFSSPFTALELLWVNLIMDGPPAIILALEPISKNLMRQKPIKRNANILTKDMLVLIIVSGVFISFVCLMQYFTNFLGANEEEKSSALFTLFVVFQLFSAFNARELSYQSILVNFMNNSLMLSVFLLTFILQILIVEFGGEAFGVNPLSLELWSKSYWWALA